MAFMERKVIDDNYISVSPEELSNKYKRVDSWRTCYKLADKLSYFFTSSQMKKIASLFSKDKDTRITTPWGIYEGSDAADRCFGMDFADLDDPDRQEELKGRLVIDNFCTPVLEVAYDNKTAQGMWVCPGVETHRENGKGKGYWSWKRIAIDFIHENDEWKIWHLNLLVCFNTPYETDWASSGKKIFTPGQIHTDKPAPEQYYYAKNKSLPLDEFDPPLPYEKWEDVAPGC